MLTAQRNKKAPRRTWTVFIGGQPVWSQIAGVATDEIDQLLRLFGKRKLSDFSSKQRAEFVCRIN